ncbi:NTF2 fold immunity protein [Pseudomonas sp. NBRC 100443]|uniref:NTF2 fold immunity protein n=1 Tax=Pseudomonas sp. NBRC 100443 TaxID=1113665 RepID=UPI0025575EC5|nr:NTF2 fold immunity protein [Pseudomonas sp. NBRC 100443]
MTEKNTPQEAMTSFLRSMKNWESYYSEKLFSAAEEDRFDDMKTIKSAAREALDEIFNTHCLKDKGDRRRLISVSMKEPTTYDPERDKIELKLKEEKKAIFEYQQTVGLESKIRFELKKNKEDIWKINTATFYDETNGKWIRWML